ncbi:MAG TPA: CopD family protein, partial [Thermomicrobiales bacterium]|nr:CopD family protein [Thermomicrobiales bacterium]
MSRTPLRFATRRLSVALLVWAGLWLVSLLTAAPVSAHATLLRSDPAAAGSFTSGPDTITLWFSEEIEVEYSRIDVLRRDGSRVLAGELARLPDSPDPTLQLTLTEPLPEGSYTVVWSTLSAVDSHISEGFFSFTVGDAILPSLTQEAELARTATSDKVVPQAVEAAVRWLNLLGQAAVAGILIFVPVVLMPVMRDADGRRLAIPARRFRLLLFAALGAVVIGHLASAVVQIMNATRSTGLSVLGEPLVSLLSGTRYGALWLSRSVLIVALAVLLWLLTRGRRLLTTGGQGRVIWIWAGWIAGLVLLTTSLGSHAAARGGAQSLPVALDVLHLLGTAIWTGGLLALVLSLPIATKAGIRTPLLRRFSVLALAAFVVLAVTGTIAALREVTSIDGLTATRYGLWFTVKMVAVAGAVGFGAWHWLVVRPALESGQETISTRAARGLRRTLRAEVGLVVLALAATGLLTSSIPARDLLDPGSPVFATTRITPEASITLRITPGQIGDNGFSVVVGPVDPDTFGELESVALRFSTDTSGERDQSIQLQQTSPNDPWTYNGSSANLALAGDWLVTANIQRTSGEYFEAAFAITANDDGLRPTGVPAPATGDDRTPELLALAGVWLLGALTLATAAWLTRRRERPALSFGLL